MALEFDTAKILGSTESRPYMVGWDVGGVRQYLRSYGENLIFSYRLVDAKRMNQDEMRHARNFLVTHLKDGYIITFQEMGLSNLAVLNRTLAVGSAL